ncbi:MAG: lysophospholipase [Defluviitaleaceae bacterium]|nr:lysophospholipase [Defluviitaleaceae bacterium]
MKKMFRKFVAPLAIIGAALATVACVYDPDFQGSLEAANVEETVAVTLMNHLTAGEYDAATALLAPELQGAFTAIPFQFHISGRHGTTFDFTVIDTIEHEGFHITTVSANHAMGHAVHNIVADANGAIAGFTTLSFDFEPMLPPADATYTAEPIVIGEGTMWALDGLLTIPQNASAENPVPALILLHGSGANNMDTAIFENRPFFDIADYLSTNGIAVLRYNERTFTHGLLLSQVYGANMTIQEEYITDALLAAQILRDDPRISSIFVLGHSLGGMVAPRIAYEGGLDGVIIFASSPRTLMEISHSQNIALIGDLVAAGALPQADADAMLADLAITHEEIRQTLTLPIEQLQDVLLLGVIPALYERSLIDSDPLAFIARNTNIPVLIQHGDRDFQTTTAEDFQVFLEGTEGMTHVTATNYLGLNHMMMTAYRQYGPLVMDIMEYRIPDRVDTRVTRDIVDWIFSNID